MEHNLRERKHDDILKNGNIRKSIYTALAEIVNLEMTKSELNGTRVVSHSILIA